MQNYFWRFFLIVLTMANAYADTNVIEAKKSYMSLFDPKLTTVATNIHSDRISRLIFEEGVKRKTTVNRVNLFSDEIKTLDLDRLINSHKIKPGKFAAYAELVSKRIVNLGLTLENNSIHIQENSIDTAKGAFYGALIGTALGLISTRIGGASQATGIDRTLMNIFVGGTGAAIGMTGGAAIGFFRGKNDQKDLDRAMLELREIQALSIEELRKTTTNQLVDDLE